MKKTLYLECNSGISGDMTVGALLDLGADRAVLEQALASLKVDGYHLHFGRTVKCGIDAYDFDVHLEEEEREHCHEGHVHEDHAHEDHDHVYSQETVHSHCHEEHAHEDHDHAHGEHVHQQHGQNLTDDHVHTHAHIHRNLNDIYTIIDRLQSSDKVKQLAKRIFEIVAEAEAKAHGLPIDQVHFHEVGAVDSIVDIISTAVCLDNLGIEEVIVSPLAEGQGYVKCQHGILPVPVPATANIAQAYGLKLHFTKAQGEMVTPTGAAIAAALYTGASLQEDYRIVKIGIGAGKKDFDHANILRAMLIEDADGEKGEKAEQADKPEEKATEKTEEKADKKAREIAEEGIDGLELLETNLDDCTGEALGFTMQLLLEAGANDVWYTPIYMKKNRPAYMLSVLCLESKREIMEEIIFTHTTSIGIRRFPTKRTALERRQMQVETDYGTAQVKVCTYKGRNYCYPEYDSVSTLCEKLENIDFNTVYSAIEKAAREQI